jgi:sulfonate transport system substrate-binding protein
VINSRQLLEKEFANDGIQVKWTFFKGAGPVINEALANGQVDFAYLGDLAASSASPAGSTPACWPPPDAG